MAAAFGAKTFEYYLYRGLSEDDGETFPYSRTLKSGDFLYSAMTQLPNGNIGILFEPDNSCKNLEFAEVSLDWIRAGDSD